ncbi:hypothetical protein L6164_026791 [Bauhinia variegata]|uniref:Uncharacterized protein n=1 Tax=Bauhinia variegata TaxID=167791 RepID=A0ACB9LRG2_BAUVA|nr:hypothetical protein L6164_026791 [Bauhinia variegata]
MLLQREVIEDAKKLIQDGIAKNFETKTSSGSSKNPICIADFGCSTGPNTYIAMQYIIEAIELQYKSHGLAAPEFQVFFNDLVANDFKTLFRNLPPNRNYFGAGVPGSFYGRLFPKETLHFIYSSSTLHLISKVPKEIIDKNSSAWNKGRINYANAPKEVVDAYATQFQKDVETFLHCRAQELADNGLMALQVGAAQDVILQQNIYPGKDIELLGSCLLDMAKVGLISEEKMDSFNLPVFFSTTKDLKTIFERNNDFTIERIEKLSPKSLFLPDVRMFVLHRRAVFEGLIENHFGEGIVDELFDRFMKKVVESPDIMKVTMLTLVVLFVLLKRKPRT